MTKSYYYLAPDISIVDLKDGNILFKSDTLAVKLGGESARFLVGQVFPLLNGENDLASICSTIKTISQEDLETHLLQLVKSGVLLSSRQPLPTRDDVNPAAPFFKHFLEIAAKDDPEQLAILQQCKIAVIGLEAHGTQTVMALLQAGIANLKLADPFPADAGYARTFPFLPAFPDSSRQACLKKYLVENYPAVQVETLAESLNKESLERFVEDCQLLIVCFDKGLTSAFYWANQISIGKKIPALFASVKGHLCFVGPFVIPEKTACYMCYKMRSIAAQEDFDEAMSYEEYLNAEKTPLFNSRYALPGALNFTATVLSGEVLKFLFAFGPLSLTDKILEFNTLSFESVKHSLIPKPDCPVCQKKNFSKIHYTADELIREHNPSDLAQLLDKLTSPHIGVIKKLEHIPKDMTEPKLPLVYMAVLANHTFLPKDQHHKLHCSGKGMDKLSAVVSAGGEAVERYSGTVYSPDDVVYRSYDQLGEAALHPKHLVLYLPEQYPGIAYSQFDPAAEIGWVSAFSLVKNQAVYVPAQAMILNYNVQTKQEYLSQTTSNGLAAGSTLLNAILSAAGEVVERDAFMIAWHNQLPCQRIDPLKHPASDVRELFIAYQRRGVELRLYKIPTDAPYHVFMGIGVQLEGYGPSAVVGLGADFSAAKAARGALLEVGQVRPAFRQRLRTPETQERLVKLLQDPSQVAELEDHDLLYGVPDKLAAFTFLFDQAVTDFDWGDRQPEKTPFEQLQTLLGFLKAQNNDLIYYNLTPADMRSLGLFTVRVVIPDFQPIHFGFKNIRLGGNRLFELPKKLGFRKNRTTVAELNMNPHPIA